MFEDIIGKKKIDSNSEVSVCPQCFSDHAWIYPKVKTNQATTVYFHCPDCGYRWAINV